MIRRFFYALIAMNFYYCWIYRIKNVEKVVKEYPIDLNAPITYEEALEVIKNIKESSPGENGLTIGFYKKYFAHFGQHFVVTFQQRQQHI